MLSIPTQPPTSAAITLDITLNNWSSFHQSFVLLCFTKFGVAGQQILFNKTIALFPFAPNQPSLALIETTMAYTSLTN